MPLFDSITQISDSIFEELGRPSDITISSISHWLRNNLGNLNILTNQSYVLNPDESVTPSIDMGSYGVFTAMYRVRYFEKQFLSGLGAAGYSIPTEVSSDGFRVKFEPKISLSKFWSDAKNQALIELNDLVNAYKIDKTLPSQIAGDDNFTRWVYPSDSAAAYVRGVEF